MNQMILFLIFGLLVAQGQALSVGDSNTVCVSKTLQYCQQVFADTLNVTLGARIWDNPATFAYIISTYYRQGGVEGGLLPVCAARQQFATCLGDRYDTCISTVNMIGFGGKTPQDAASFVGQLRALEFDCDGGFIQSSKNFDCINLATQIKSANLTACWTTYQQSLKSVATCDAANDYVNCMSAVYGNVCGAETSWWECERTRLGQLFDESCPSISCQIIASPSHSSQPGNRLTRISQLLNNAQQSDISRVIRSLVNNNNNKNNKIYHN